MLFIRTTILWLLPSAAPFSSGARLCFCLFVDKPKSIYLLGWVAWLIVTTGIPPPKEFFQQNSPNESKSRAGIFLLIVFLAYHVLSGACRLPLLKNSCFRSMSHKNLKNSEHENHGIANTKQAKTPDENQTQDFSRYPIHCSFNSCRCCFWWGITWLSSC